MPASLGLEHVFSDATRVLQTNARRLWHGFSMAWGLIPHWGFGFSTQNACPIPPSFLWHRRNSQEHIVLHEKDAYQGVSHHADVYDLITVAAAILRERDMFTRSRAVRGTMSGESHHDAELQQQSDGAYDVASECSADSRDPR